MMIWRNYVQFFEIPKQYSTLLVPFLFFGILTEVIIKDYGVVDTVTELDENLVSQKQYNEWTMPVDQPILV